MQSELLFVKMSSNPCGQQPVRGVDFCFGGPVLRVAILAISAVTTGLSLGRKYAGRQIERRKEMVITEAAEEARDRIKSHARELMQASTRTFLRRILIKALILSLIWFAHWGGLLMGHALAIVMSGTIGLFVVADVVLNWQMIRLLAAEVRRHGLKPKTALSQAVAARVFEEVLEESDRRNENHWHEKVILALAGKDRTAISREIAQAVADIARETSWADLRPFLIGTGLRLGALTLLYSGFAWLMVMRATSTG